MKNPGSAYNDPLIGKDPQPGHMRDYVALPETPDDDMGGVHINSGIPNHAFYLFATAIGGFAWETAGQVWYEALQRSKKDTNFEQFANLTFSVAGENVDAATQQAVQSAWAEVGIMVSKKERNHPAKAGVRSEQAHNDLAEAIGRLAAQVGILQKDIDFLKQSANQPH
jgi:hypothetical protein